MNLYRPIQIAKSIWLLLLCLILTSKLPLLSQSIELERIPNELGLSQNLISALCQDKQGFIWVGTKDGLNRFDGYTFKVFQHDPFDSTSISDNNIRCILEDKQGRLWVGTANGLNLMDRNSHTFQRLLPQEEIDENAPDIIQNFSGLSDKGIFSLLEDNQGNIWIGTRQGGAVKMELPATSRDFKEAKFTIFRPTVKENTLAYGGVKLIKQDEKGTIWLHTRSRLSRIFKDRHGQYQMKKFLWSDFDPQWPNYRQENFKIIGQNGSQLDNQFYSIINDEKGALWVASAGGFAKWLPHQNSFKLFPFDVDLLPSGDSPIEGADGKSGFLDSKGRIWLDGHRNFIIYDTLNHQLPARFFAKDKDTPIFLKSGVNTLLKDANENVWIGTDGKGLFKCSPYQKRFSGQPDAQLYTTQSIRTLYQTSDEAIWIGTTDQRLIRIDPLTNQREYIILDETKWPREYRLEFDLVFAMQQDAAGDLWIGGGRGLFRLFRTADGQWDRDHHEIYPHDFDYPNVLDMHITESGEIWLLTHFEFGKYDPITKRFDGHNYIKISNGEKEMGHNVPQIYQQNDQIFWLATSDGLLKYELDKEAFSLYSNDKKDVNTLSHSNVKCILPDPSSPDSVLWLGTGGGGLNRFDIQSGQFTHFKKEDGLPDNVIYAILDDEDGNFWMSTNQGLSRFNPQTGLFKSYTTESGLQDNEFNSGAYFKGKDGRLFFGGIGGFNTFMPSAVRDDLYKPTIVITDFKLANQSVNFKDEDVPLKGDVSQVKELELTWEDNIFSFEFAALDFTDSKRNQYAYMLENFDNDWQYIGTQRTATFTNIDPGEYIFRVKGTNHDGTWNEEGTSLKIIILPPWWQTWWAYGFYLAGLAIAIIGFYRFQLKRRLEQSEVEKTKEMEAMKSRFYTNMTHEFRTPLTVIMGITEQLSIGKWQSALKATDKEKLRTSFSLLHRNGENLLRLINQLLDLSKVDSGNLKLELIQGDIIPYLNYLTESFYSKAEEKKIRLVFYTEEEGLLMDFDEVKIQYIVYNLLSNALKFTEQHGKIIFHAQQEKEDGSPILKLKVSDNGIGIPADELPHIFDRFHQVEAGSTRRGEGTGIGLTFTKELVELMNGTIEVQSEVGKGTSFTVVLPITNEQEMSTFSSAMDTKETPRNGVKINKTPATNGQLEKAPLREDLPIVLVIEDNPDVATYISQILEEEYTIELAKNGQIGVEKALELIPDLILSDVMMPIKDGFEVTETLKKDPRTSHIPIVLLTAKATQKDKIDGLSVGADAYLMKPFNKAELMIRLENLLALRKAVQEKYAGINISDTSGFANAAIKANLTQEDIFLQKLQNAVTENLDDPKLNTEKLCEAVNLRQTQLYRKLKALTNETPNSFIRNIRLKKAMELLKNSDLNISEIAYEVGFNDPNYFSRSFHQLYGKSPSIFRK